MKTLTKIYALLLLIGFTTTATWAQEWSFGPKVYTGISKQPTVGDQVQIGNSTLSSVNYGNAIGNSVGAFARYDHPYWYVQVESMYGTYSLTNAQASNASGVMVIYPAVRRTDVRIMAGAKPLPWLRLNAGLTTAFNRPRKLNYASLIDGYLKGTQEIILINPSQEEIFKGQVVLYKIAGDFQDSYKKTNLEGQIGIGADIGGLTLDLNYARSLTPVVDGVTVQNQTYAFKQNYGYWSLGLGYKLFPLKRHLLAPRKNKAYARIKQDIPFYRNEFYVAAGLSAEDIGGPTVYENRYTRYFSRRVGITGSLNYLHNPLTTDERYGGYVFSRFSLLTGVRFLPLYSRRHTIGITAGPALNYNSELRSSTYQQSVNGQLVNYLSLQRNANTSNLGLGWHSSIDYNLALTNRLIAGPWLRVLGESSIIPNYVTAGIQAGYRF